MIDAEIYSCNRCDVDETIEPIGECACGETFCGECYKPHEQLCGVLNG